jgi:Cu+-exporting ATPase
MNMSVSVHGMHCAGCVRTIEDAVRALPGVATAEVNFAAEQADLDIDPATFRAIDFRQALRDLGYRVVPRRAVYRVQGLDPSGIAALEEQLRALPGMLAASAGYATATVAVDLLFDAGVEAFLRSRGLSPAPEELRTRDTEAILLALKTIASIALAAAVMALSMLHIGPHWLPLALAAPVQFWTGWTFHAGFLRSIRHFRADMNGLISIGTNAAFFAGYVDTSATIIAIVLLGRFLESRARRGTRRVVEALLDLAPRAELKPGDERLVKPGERLPADGVILEGTGALDESMVTGESDPVDKKPGDRVIGGTLNRTGALRIRFDRTGDDTMLAQIVRLVRETQGSKPPEQRLADLWASRFVPLVLVVALITLGGWLLIDPSQALAATVAVLVVACPCAFGLATPVAIMVAAGRAARMGILFKDAAALEGIGRLDRIVFDKTGTLTEGRPSVTGFTSNEALRLAAAVERASEHPLAKAIVAVAPMGVTATDFDARPGLGAVAKVEGCEVVVGNRSFFSLLDIDFSPHQRDIQAAVAMGETAVLVGKEGICVGLITIADQPRPEAAGVVRDLLVLGMRVSMLTGDDATTAAAMAQRLGIGDVKAEVMPPDKAVVIREFQKHERVGMVGDGINDAPALAQADVAMAVAQGADVAIESADVILMKNDLGRIVSAIRLSRATRRVIHQNFAWAFGYNGLLIPLAVGGTLDPMIAAAAMALSSITVVVNSLRLGR